MESSCGVEDRCFVGDNGAKGCRSEIEARVGWLCARGVTSDGAELAADMTHVCGLDESVPTVAVPAPKPRVPVPVAPDHALELALEEQQLHVEAWRSATGRWRYGKWHWQCDGRRYGE